MFHELEKEEIVEYNSEKKLFLLNDKGFHPLTGELEHLSTKPVICVGSYPLGRELFYFDPINSPLLQAHATALMSQVPENSTTLQILDFVLDYIRTSIFEIKTCHEAAVKRFIQKRKLISIEEFIQTKIGICRHLAFVSTYLLDQLIQHNLLFGKVHYVRDIIPQGGHAWSLFIDSTGKMWHLDPMWNVIQSLSEPAEFEILCDLYGQAAMERQLKRSIN